MPDKPQKPFVPLRFPTIGLPRVGLATQAPSPAAAGTQPVGNPSARLPPTPGPAQPEPQPRQPLRPAFHLPRLALPNARPSQPPAASPVPLARPASPALPASSQPVRPSAGPLPPGHPRPVVMPTRPLIPALGSSGMAGGLRPQQREETSSQLPNLPIPVAAEAVHRFKPINEAQVVYEPVSTVNPTGAAIPAPMAAATRKALLALQERVGLLDEWVAERCGWSIEELGSRLTSEQVDGVALAVDAADRGAGLIIADATGFGKGRLLATTTLAVAITQARAGRPVIFLTEKDNLFSDFWRDIRDIGADGVFGRPFMLNEGAKLIDTTSAEGAVLVPAMKKAELNRVIRSGALPEGCRIMFATYSQFNRPGTLKAQFLMNVAHQAHIASDEAHNFVGTESNTSKIIGEGLEQAASSTFSSATYGRNVLNLRAYSTVFPWLKEVEELEDFTPAQMRALAEYSVRLATERGNVIRREHDLSNMTLQVIETGRNLQRNEALTDQLAPILVEMARLGRKVSGWIMRRNEKNQENIADMPPGERRSAREFWFNANFGSRLSSLMGQFQVSLLVDDAIQQSVEALRQGKKPVVVVGSTMESLMRELAREPSENEVSEEDEAVPADEPEDEENPEAELVTTPPTFGEALRIMADRLLRVSVRRGKADKEQVILDEPDFVAACERIKAMAADFPSLSLSPIDDIRDGIEAAGQEYHAAGLIPEPWVTDEVSGRTMRVRDGQYVSVAKKDRNVTVARFNSNLVHCLVLTSSGSTGLSAHDGPAFPHHAPRVMIEIDPLKNVVQRVQMWGRVFRRGQLSEPEFQVLSTGLLHQVYNMAMDNRKLMDLTASVTGSGTSLQRIDVPDMINAVGNEVARDFFMDNPTLADLMSVSLNVESEGEGDLYYINKFRQRLCFLPSREERRQAFEAVTAAYQDRLLAGAASEHSGRTLEGEWQVVRRQLLEAGDGSDSPVTGTDVVVATLATRRDVHPLSTATIQHLIGKARAALESERPSIGSIRQAIRRQRMDVLLQALPERRFPSVDFALRSRDDNPVKRADARLKALDFLLERFQPGISASLPGEDAEPVNALVIDLVPPTDGDYTRPGEYQLVYAIPGEEKTRSISLTLLVKGGAMNLGTEGAGQSLLPQFDRAPRGQVDVERKVLEGSIASILTARRIGGGTPVQWMGGSGELQHGILLPKSVAKRLVGVPGMTAIVPAAAAVLRAGGRLRTESVNVTEGVEFRPQAGGRVRVSISAKKAASEKWCTPEFVQLVGEMEELTYAKEACISASDAEALLRHLRQRGCSFHFDGAYRKTALAAAEAWRAELEQEVVPQLARGR